MAVVPRQWLLHTFPGRALVYLVHDRLYRLGHCWRHRRLALVGHEPDLGELAAKLLGARGMVEFKKGGVCLIDVDGATPGGPGTLRWMLPPKALRALAP